MATKPWNTTKVTAHGINNEPQVLFTEVQRHVEVSHWGNIAITEKYSILNVGPGIKGEFSRVEFNRYNDQAGKNTFKSIQANLPAEAWGLYYRDEVGNISTSRAYKDVTESLN
jgi:oligosaccharyltransferase complex subunit alpha (ribophorin I)